MFNMIDRRIRKIANLRNVLLLVFTFVAFSIIIFNFGFIPKIAHYSQGADILDNTFNYTAYQVYRLFSSYGDEGRSLYLWHLLLFDFVYPVLFAFTFSVLLAYLSERLFHNVGRFRYLYLIPFAAILLDYLENAGILTMLLNYPTQMAGVVIIANVITMLKLTVSNILIMVTLLALVGLLVKKLYQRLRRVQSNSST